MKIFFSLLLTLSLFGDDLLDLYRLNGLHSVQKKLDLELTSYEYWVKHLEGIDTRLGYIQKHNTLLTCDKSQSLLKLYIKDSNQTFTFQRNYSAFTGKIDGDKQREGDLKTPIGVYHITNKLTKLDPFYGPLAFVTSYPNTYDKYLGKNGSGIWIHGLPKEQSRDTFTRGCIAINNKSLECLDKRIDIHKTLLIIDDNTYVPKVSKDIFAAILTELFKWRYAWIHNDIDGYLSFYHSNFIRENGMNLERFSQYKKRIFKKGEPKNILFKGINIIPYPNKQNIFYIHFFEDYYSPSYTFQGDKTLIVEYKKQKIYILTES